MAAKPKILIIYPVEDDPQTMVLYEEILNKGGQPILMPFNLIDSNYSPLKISYDGTSLQLGEALDDIKAVFLRGVAIDLPLVMPPYVNEYEALIWRAKYLKENYKISLITSLLKILERKGALIINPIASYLNHNTKTQMFVKLSVNGVSVPKTFATNDIKYLEKQYGEDNNIIMKSQSGVGATRDVRGISEKDASQLQYCPALFQTKINGNTIRVHTVGEKVVLALRIFATDVDSRSDTSGFEYIQLKMNHQNQFTKANKILGLKFSAWDAIIDENDKIFLLDCNPGPYIWWIGSYFTRVVKSCLAKYLVRWGETSSLDEAEKACKVPQVIIDKIHKIDPEALSMVSDILHDWKKDMRHNY